MDAQIAELVLYAITAVAVIVWGVALRFLSASRRVQEGPPAERFEPGTPPSENLVAGSADIEGQPSELAAKAASVLAKESGGPLGQMKILQRTDDRVVFEGVGPSPASGSAGPCFRRGELRFTPLDRDRTCVDYAVDVSGGKGLLLGGAIFQLVGIIAILVGFILFRTLVVPNQDPEIRWQTFQMIQVGHLLWPPFLFGALYRRKYSVVRAGFDALVHNLPYHSE